MLASRVCPVQKALRWWVYRSKHTAGERPRPSAQSHSRVAKPGSGPQTWGATVLLQKSCHSSAPVALYSGESSRKEGSRSGMLSASR